MIVQWAAVALILLYFLLDTFLRKGTSAKLPKTELDKKTTAWIIIAMGVVVVVAELLTYFNFGRFNKLPVAWCGLALMGVGFLIRVVSILQLKEAYTRTLKVEADQQLVTSGMYRSIRHPGYLGSVIIWFFFGVAIGNIYVLAISIALVGSAYCNRIVQEERMLAQRYGPGYEDYRQHSWRLLPYIW